VTDAQWEGVWGVVKGCWPNAYLDDVEAKQNWREVFRGKDPRAVIDAARQRASEVETPTIAGLMVTCHELEQERLRDERMRLASGPPQEWQRDSPGPMPDFDEAYEAIPEEQREFIEEHFKTRYTAAYDGRNVPGNMRWAWRCLVVTCSQQGIDQTTGRYNGSTWESDREAEEAKYQRVLTAAHAQIQHEQVCPRCSIYSNPGPGKAAKGSPCPVGLAYYEPHYLAGMPRP
jgi:hypothetical protein